MAGGVHDGKDDVDDDESWCLPRTERWSHER